MSKESALNHVVLHLPNREVLVLRGQARIYARKSVAKERANRSIDEQVENAIRQCHRMGIPIGPEDVRAEAPGFGGDLFWKGGGNFSALDQRHRRTRPELTKLVTEVQNDLVKVILVWDFTRLWRSTEICGALVNLFHQKGVVLLDRLGFADVVSPEGRKRLHDASAVAQEYRELCSVNIRRSFDDKRERGEAVVVHRCLGYVPEGKSRVRPVPEELAIVNRIFRMYVHGESGEGPMAAIAIADRMNAEGLGSAFPTTNVKGRSLNPTGFLYVPRILKILRSPRYVGKQLTPDGELRPAVEYLVDGATAVDVDLWEAAQVKLLRTSKVAPRRVRGKAVSGLLRCGGCGKLYILSSGKPKDVRDPATGLVRTIQTSSAWRVRYINSFHHCRHFPTALCPYELDDFIRRELFPILLIELRARRDQVKQTALRSRLAEMRLQKAQQESRLRELLKDVLRGGDSSIARSRLEDAANELLLEIDAEIFATEWELKRAVEDAANLENLDGMTDSMYREILRSLIVWMAVVPTPSSKGSRRGPRPKTDSPILARILILTAWGTHHTAIVERGGQAREVNRSYPTTVLRVAEASEALGTIRDLPEPQRFFENVRREQIHLRTRGVFNPEVWAPGFGTPTQTELVDVVDIREFENGGGLEPT